MIINYNILYMMNELIDSNDWNNFDIMLNNHYKNNIDIPKCVYDRFIKHKPDIKSDISNYKGIVKLLSQYEEYKNE